MGSRTDWYTRANWPAELRDTDLWPRVDLAEAPERVRTRIENRQRAIRAYLEGHVLDAICGECQVSKAELLRHLNRCMAMHPDGRIYGWRALLPHEHINPYVRWNRPREGSRGLAGAFQQFLRDHPTLREALDAAILRNKSDAVRESRMSHLAIYNQFKRLCRQDGISETRYPFNTSDRGERALRRYTVSVSPATG